MGRLIDPSLYEEVIRRVKSGETAATACKAAGVKKGSFSSWIYKRGGLRALKKKASPDTKALVAKESSSADKLQEARRLVLSGESVVSACKEAGLPTSMYYRHLSGSKRKTKSKPEILTFNVPDQAPPRMKMVVFTGEASELTTILTGIWG